MVGEIQAAFGRGAAVGSGGGLENEASLSQAAVGSFAHTVLDARASGATSAVATLRGDTLCCSRGGSVARSRANKGSIAFAALVASGLALAESPLVTSEGDWSRAGAVESETPSSVGPTSVEGTITYHQLRGSSLSSRSPKSCRGQEMPVKSFPRRSTTSGRQRRFARKGCRWSASADYDAWGTEGQRKRGSAVWQWWQS